MNIDLAIMSEKPASQSDPVETATESTNEPNDADKTEADKPSHSNAESIPATSDENADKEPCTTTLDPPTTTDDSVAKKCDTTTMDVDAKCTATNTCTDSKGNAPDDETKPNDTGKSDGADSLATGGDIPDNSANDEIFEPSLEMMVNDYDDERTLEEEEALAAAESNDPTSELDSLQRVNLYLYEKSRISQIQKFELNIFGRTYRQTIKIPNCLLISRLIHKYF